MDIKKNFVITGSTSGIGRALAYRLDTPTNHLILTGRSQEKLLLLSKELRTSTTVIVADLEDIDNISSISQHFPINIDGYVHAAGLESIEPLKLINYKKYDRLMRLHLYSFVEILKIIEKRKKRDDEYLTSVVAISSIASDNGGMGQTMYASSKAALEATLRILSKELSPKRIRINAIKPGIVNTEMTGRWMQRIGINDISEVEKMQVNGIAQPEDIVDLIEFLLSDKSKHIIGTSIKVDGGGPSGKIF